MSKQIALWLLLGLTAALGALSACSQDQDPPAVVSCMNENNEQALTAAHTLQDYLHQRVDQERAAGQYGSAAAADVAASVLRDEQRLQAMVRAECWAVIPAK